MSFLRKCLLRSVKTGREIVLDHRKEVTVGRGPQTEITDTKVSKCQVSLIADIDACSVLIKCQGSNPSGINNKKLQKNETSTLRHGDQVEFLLGRYFYKVEFVPSPDPIDGVHNVNDNELSSKRNSSHQNDTNGIPLKRSRMSVDQNESKNNNVCKKDLWEDIDHGKLLIFTTAETRSSCKIASYDLDGTLILTKSGKVFPQNRDDWTLANSAVKPTLKKLIDDGYKIVIFTNQAGISRGKTSIPDFKYKIEKIAEALGVPVQVFIATSEDIYRKPAPGMWDILVRKKNSGLCIDINESFYVGDAAGREQNWMPKKKKDFSSADRLFALNIGLKFQTPEAHFLNQPEGRYKLPEFQPTNLNVNVPISSSNLTSKTKEVVILVGSPGSGKTFFVSKYLLPAGYIHINRDTLGSWQRCVSKMESALSNNKSVVIDNTNPDKASRKRYLDIAAKLNITCRCFVLKTSIEHSKHNNKFRQLVHEDHVFVNEIMINSYRKKLEPPTEDEGFAEIVEINFVPKFDDPERERLYKMFLV